MKIFAPLLTLLACTVAHADCLPYSAEVTIAGSLTEQTFPEQPNYADIAKGDAAATYLFVSPRNPICVRAGNPNDNQPAEAKIGRIQLVFEVESASTEYKRLRSLLGKRVACAGTLYHAISGHHHSAVLLFKAKCNAA